MIRRTPLPSANHSRSPEGGEARRGEEQDGILELKELNAFQIATVQQLQVLQEVCHVGIPV